jgi:RNA polymerase sigma-70 factor, ECF subfamily
VTSVATERDQPASGDAALIRRAGRGDLAAFDLLVASRLDRCYRLAWAILENDADAADATQEAFLAAWRQLSRLRDPAAFDGWLNRIVANAARMSRRHTVRLREVPADPVDDRAESAGRQRAEVAIVERPGPLDAVAERDLIARAFDRLRPEERSILTLHHLDDRPVAEIARTLGIPVGTAKWRLHAARRALERAMEAEA